MLQVPCSKVNIVQPRPSEGQVLKTKSTWLRLHAALRNRWFTPKPLTGCQCCSLSRLQPKLPMRTLSIAYWTWPRLWLPIPFSSQQLNWRHYSLQFDHHCVEHNPLSGIVYPNTCLSLCVHTSDTGVGTFQSMAGH